MILFLFCPGRDPGGTESGGSGLTLARYILVYSLPWRIFLFAFVFRKTESLILALSLFS